MFWRSVPLDSLVNGKRAQRLELARFGDLCRCSRLVANGTLAVSVGLDSFGEHRVVLACSEPSMFGEPAQVRAPRAELVGRACA